MDKLIQYMEDFGTSEPIFKIGMSEQNNNLNLTLNVEYKPTPIEGDAISELVCSNFHESFRLHNGDGTFIINKESIASQTMSSILSSIRLLLERNLKMKSPRQSNLYRWLYRSRSHKIDSNGLILIYKYIKPYCNEDMVVNPESTVHWTNAHLLLQAMMEKSSEK